MNLEVSQQVLDHLRPAASWGFPRGPGFLKLCVVTARPRACATPRKPRRRNPAFVLAPIARMAGLPIPRRGDLVHPVRQRPRRNRILRRIVRRVDQPIQEPALLKELGIRILDPPRWLTTRTNRARAVSRTHGSSPPYGCPRRPPGRADPRAPTPSGNISEGQMTLISLMSGARNPVAWDSSSSRNRLSETEPPHMYCLSESASRKRSIRLASSTNNSVPHLGGLERACGARRR